MLLNAQVPNGKALQRLKTKWCKFFHTFIFPKNPIRAYSDLFRLIRNFSGGPFSPDENMLKLEKQRTISNSPFGPIRTYSDFWGSAISGFIRTYTESVWAKTPALSVCRHFVTCTIPTSTSKMVWSNSSFLSWNVSRCFANFSQLDGMNAHQYPLPLSWDLPRQKTVGQADGSTNDHFIK